jgi:hypothetical protein
MHQFVHPKFFALLIYVLVWSVSCQTLSAATVSRFLAFADNDRVYVRWTSDNETGLIRYELYRRTDTQPQPQLITTVSPLGNAQNYEFIDMLPNNRLGGDGNPSGTARLTANRYVYTLRMISSSGSTEMEATAQFQTSSVRRTWGSIKALFR